MYKNTAKATQLGAPFGAYRPVDYLRFFPAALGRLGLANAYLLGTLMSGFLLPWGGRLVDRFGARSTATVAAEV